MNSTFYEFINIEEGRPAMHLQEKLTALKKNFEAKAPGEALQIMHRATDDLRKSGILDRALTVGDKVPDFSLNNAEGRPIQPKDYQTQSPFVISFYRGKWWPYCNLELDALQNAAGELQALGAALIAISPQSETYNRQLIEEKKLTFEVLSDPGNQVAKKLGLVYKVPEDLKQIYLQFGIDLEKYNGDDSWTLPIPARYIVDQAGLIVYRESDPDYTIRPEPEHTVSALRALKL